MSKTFQVGDVLTAQDMNRVGEDTGWLPLTITGAGWETPAGAQAPQARRIGQVVYLRGIVRNTTFVGGFTDLGTLPSTIPGPDTPNGVVSSVAQNTSRRATVRVFSSRVLQVYCSVAGADWLNLSPITYPID